jgi:integrase
MRLSEVLALSWNDVDFVAGVVHVRHQLARGRRGVPPYRIPPKTRASVREIPLLPQLAAVLRQHKHGSRFASGTDYVFATANGTPFLHHNVSKRVLRRAATGAGLDRDGRRVRFHDLRHTFASHLIIDIRLDVAQVSRILGHARTSITLDTYTHLFEHAAHAADVRTQLAHSPFATMLAETLSTAEANSTRATQAPIQRRRGHGRRASAHPCQHRNGGQRHHLPEPRLLLDETLPTALTRRNRQHD